jgi:3-isopropylmalate/(R)-2-methylmalate dehydratase small subunit
MEPVRQVTGTAVPLRRSDVDTDQIIPSEWLKRVERTGFGAGLFSEWRADPDFVLNQPRYAGASVLITGPNFGCGSSREHAVWGLRQLGLRCVIGSSFGGIFGDNCTRNGVPAITLPPAQVERLMKLAADPARCQLTVDLERQTIASADGVTLPFEFDPLRRHMLLKGLDAVGLTMESAEEIRRFEQTYLQAQPWLA